MTLRRVLYADRCSFPGLNASTGSPERSTSITRFARVIPAAAALTWLALAQLATAQAFDPPPGAAEPADAPSAATTSQAAPADNSIQAEGTAMEPVDSLADLGLESPRNAPRTFDPSDGGSIADNDVIPDETRAESLKQGLGLRGASGLTRVQSASVGSPGTFRLSLMTGMYSGSGFLCPPCQDESDSSSTVPDQGDRVAAHFFLSATPADFLEIYAGIYSFSTSTNLPVSQLKQVVGDWSLGAKALFLKPAVDQVFSVGGSADLAFATGSGQVGFSGIDSVNLGLRVVASADFNQMRGSGLPVKVHANLGYLFDNSGSLIEDYEKGIGDYIQRIERFSLGINRVDSIPFGIGAEATLNAVRPFAEWSADIPITHLRGDFRCTRSIADQHPGDNCMQDAAGLSTSPSRLTVGARVLPWELAPWWMDGIALVGAADIGTGAVSKFLVEVAPELPWNVWFGLSMAANTQPQVIVQEVNLPLPELPPEALRVHGIVVEKDSETAIANALIHFDGRNMTGLISTSEGDFLTAALDPGLYTFRISAEGYKEGTCSVEILGPDDSAEPPQPTPTSQRWQTPAPKAYASANAPEDLGPPGLRCELEPLPLVSNVNGRVQDGSSGVAVGTAVASITDVLGRQLELQVDEVGAFRFQNVPPGAALITLGAAGFLTSVTELTVEAPQEIHRTFVLFPVPDKPTVTLKKDKLITELALVFEAGSSVLSPATTRVIQELAAYLGEHDELGSIEVQGHCSGAEEEELSSTRANAIRNALILHGVTSGRLTAKGYGNSVPSSGGNNNADNDRIEFSVTKQESTTLPF